jgi:transposase
MQSQRAHSLQSVSLSSQQFGSEVLQQDQALPRVATQYDKLAANYLAFVQLASIRLWLRANESTP